MAHRSTRAAVAAVLILTTTAAMAIAEETPAQPAEAAAAGGGTGTASADEKPGWDIRANYKGLAIGTDDGRFEFAFGGRLQVDFAGFIEGITPMGNGAELRRARIKSYGTVFSDWDYKLEVNFDTNAEVSLTDAWIRYSGFKPFTVTIGHQKVPFSQQSMTSSNWQVFQERALLDGFIDNSESGRRRLGIVAGTYGRFFNFYGGFFGEGVAFDGTTDEDWGTAYRLVLLPIAEKRRVLTAGASVYYRQLFDANDNLRYRSKPSSHIAGNRLVDTYNLAAATDFLAVNVESSLVWRFLHAQGEYTMTKVYRAGGRPTLYYDGWYVQAGAFLTGESRNYDPKSGKYKRPMPEHKWGAFEVAIRFARMDLQDQDIQGGSEDDLTTALNWWTNKNIMFRFNYNYAMARPNSYAQNAVSPPAPAGPTFGQVENVHVFMGRAQIVF